MVQVKIFYAHNDLRNFSYLIWDKNSGHAWVIDPFDEKPIIDNIKKDGLLLQGILNTHQHWDHIKGNSALQSAFHCPVCPRTTGLIQLSDEHSIEFTDTPGHTSDHQAFIWKQNDHIEGLFSGDTLFNSGVGNCKNGGNVDVLFSTTMDLLKLPDDVVLYPGHDYILKNLLFAKSCEPTNMAIDEALRMVRESDTEMGVCWTLGQEKSVNPFFRLSSDEIQQKILADDLETMEKSSVEKQLFKKLRSLRDNW